MGIVTRRQECLKEKERNECGDPLCTRTLRACKCLFTCMCTRASLNRMNQWLEKRPAFCRVSDLLLLSQTKRRCGSRRTSCKGIHSFREREKIPFPINPAPIDGPARRGERGWRATGLKRCCAHRGFSRVSLPEKEGALGLLLPPPQGQREALILAAALMEGLVLWR